MAFASSRSSGDHLPRISMMEEAGLKLKRVRERLGLKYRDVEEATARIAATYHNDEFVVAISRLADIENKGTVPSIHRLYALCAIYLLDLTDVLSWYGISLGNLAADATLMEREKTHVVGFKPREDAEVEFPLVLEPGIDVSKTVFLSRVIQRWGKVPLMLLGRQDLRNRKCALIGTEDWSMYPIIPPGALVVIDDSRRRVVSSGWKTELDRPIYFLEHRDGYACCWCILRDSTLTLLPHPASNGEPQSYKYPSEIEVLGQVTHVAMTIDPGQRRRLRREELTL